MVMWKGILCRVVVKTELKKRTGRCTSHRDKADIILKTKQPKTQYSQGTLYQNVPTFNDPGKEGCSKHWGKVKKCLKKAFLLFQQCFFPI